MRTASDPLGDLIFGQTRGRILARIFGHPDERFYVRQISRDSGTSVGAVQRELESLFQTGLIVRSMSGRQVYYQANRNHPVFAEIRSLVAKTVGIFQILRSALTPFADRVSLAFLYGSVARRAEGAESDVDLMVVGDVTLDEILAEMAPAERMIGRTINPTVYSTKELKEKLQSGNHFLRSVMRGEKVILIGDEGEFGNMG
jgi:predicted nucleotidyltransferase